MVELMLFPISLQYLSLDYLLTFLSAIQPLIITLFGFAIFAIFVLEFYEFISTRDIFKEGSAYSQAREAFKHRESTSSALNNFILALEYLFLFPFIVFFWAAMFFLVIVAVSASPEVNTILLTSIAIVGAIRICAYYRRKIAEDVAKLLPLVLLADFVLDFRIISFIETYEVVKNAVFDPSFQFLAFNYFIMLIVLEFILRVVTLFWKHRKAFKREREEFEEKISSDGIVAEETED